MRNLTAILFLALASTMFGQNLVNNPSFELYTNCPTGSSQFNVLNWQVTANSGQATPDFYHICGSGSAGVPVNVVGNQNAYDGNGYAGIYCYNTSSAIREYIQSQLISPLVGGQTYYVSFRVSLGDTYGVAIGSLGAHFSTNAITGNGTIEPINVTPQVVGNSIISDRDNWVQVAGSFIANGGEEYITIGNFSSDATTPIDINPNSFINWMSYYFIDMVEVTTTPLGTHEFYNAGAIISPNPFNDTIAIEYENKSADDIIKVFSVNGQMLRKISGVVDTINLSDLPKGVYLISISTQNSGRLAKKIIKT